MSAKILKKLKKMNTLKSEKTKLKDKIFSMINKCSNRSELKGIEKTLSYYPILKDDEHWDEGYFFNLIEFKLNKMYEYFNTHHIVENEQEYAKQCYKAIRILKAGYKTDIVLNEDLYNYVNEKNKDRFFSKQEAKFLNTPEIYNKYGKALIREAKAKALFWKYLYHYVERWWD